MFSSFSFSSRCLYSAYVLLIVSSLALFNFGHLLSNKYTLPLLMTLFRHSHFLCCSMPSFGVSTVSPKKSSPFSMFSTSSIAFVTCRNRHHTTNNIRYKGNSLNTFVIIFLIGTFCKLNKNSQQWYFPWESLQEVFVMLVVVVLHSLLFL